MPRQRPSTRCRQLSGKCRNRVGGRRKISVVRKTGAGAGPKIVIAVADPGERDRFRKRKSFDFGPVAERVAFALDDQRRALQRFEMCRSELIGFAGRMKRIAETDEAGDIALLVEFVGNETSNAPAERLAANQQLLTALPPLLLRTEPFRDIPKPTLRLAEVDASIRRCALPPCSRTRSGSRRCHAAR